MSYADLIQEERTLWIEVTTHAYATNPDRSSNEEHSEWARIYAQWKTCRDELQAAAFA
jgi:hypothetical protein